MNIPETLNFRALLFGDGPKGSYTQVHRNDQYGLTVSVHAETRKATPVETWTQDDLEEREWSSLGELAADPDILALPEPPPEEEVERKPGPFDHLFDDRDPRIDELENLDDPEEDIPF